MKKIKLIVEIESDGISTNVQVDGVDTGIDNLPQSLKDVIEEWHPADIISAIYLAENE